MDPVANPYTPNAGSAPPILAGRDSQILSFTILIQRLRAGRSEKNLLIVGLRGVGKTVLLNKFKDVAESAGFRTGQTEITTGTNLKETIARMARRIILSMDIKERARDAAWKAARVFKAFTLKTPEGYELGFDVEALRGNADSGTLREDLADLFVAIGEAARERGSGIAIFLDEIHLLKNEDFEALIAATHQLAQKGLPFAVIGAGLPQLPKLAGEAKSYAERLFEFPVIDKLAEEHARLALEKPAHDHGVDYSPQAIQAILKFTSGYPYFLQEYGKHVWNIAPGPTRIEIKDVEDARPNVIAQLDESFFRVRIDRATPTEKRYMSAMASLGEGPYRTGAIAEAMGQQASTVAPIRSRLIDKGHIYSPSHSLTDFTVPMFDDFMRRNFPEPKD